MVHIWSMPADRDRLIRGDWQLCRARLLASPTTHGSSCWHRVLLFNVDVSRLANMRDGCVVDVLTVTASEDDGGLDLELYYPTLVRAGGIERLVDPPAGSCRNPLLAVDIIEW